MRLAPVVVLTTGPEACNSSRHNHHPEHSQLTCSMRRGCQDDTQDEEERREHNPCPSTDLVNHEPEEQHPEDLADEIGVGQASLDDAGHPVLVKLGE